MADRELPQLVVFDGSEQMSKDPKDWQELVLRHVSTQLAMMDAIIIQGKMQNQNTKVTETIYNDLMTAAEKCCPGFEKATKAASPRFGGDDGRCYTKGTGTRQ